jgi:hypothetical protein
VNLGAGEQGTDLVLADRPEHAGSDSSGLAIEKAHEAGGSARESHCTVEDLLEEVIDVEHSHDAPGGSEKRHQIRRPLLGPAVESRAMDDSCGLVGEHLGHSQVVVAEMPFSFENRDAEDSDCPAPDAERDHGTR